MLDLNSINWKKMKTVGAGSNNVVFTDGKLAVKFGNVDQDEVDLMDEAAKFDLSVPVLYFKESVNLSSDIMQMMYDYPRKFYYDHKDDEPWPLYSIKKKSRANVLVTPYAKPLLNNAKEYSPKWVDRCNLLVERVKAEYREVVGKIWQDDHPWNLGYYRGNLVILDF